MNKTGPIFLPHRVPLISHFFGPYRRALFGFECVGGSVRPRLSLNGFVSQSGVFHLRVDSRQELGSPADLFETGTTRFLKRPKQRDYPHRQFMWGEAVKGVGRGGSRPRANLIGRVNLSIRMMNYSIRRFDPLYTDPVKSV